MLSLAQVKSIENKRRRKERNPHTVLPVISPNTRYLRFWQSVQFRCIRSGILLPAGESPDTFREHLTYDHLWIYEHENGSILGEFLFPPHKDRTILTYCPTICAL